MNPSLTKPLKQNNEQPAKSLTAKAILKNPQSLSAAKDNENWHQKMVPARQGATDHEAVPSRVGDVVVQFTGLIMSMSSCYRHGKNGAKEIRFDRRKK